MGMTVDLQDFEKGFKNLIEKSVPKAVSQGVFRAGNEMLRDAIYEIPKAPFDEGHLRASARTQYGGKGSLRRFANSKIPPMSIDAAEAGGYSLIVGFNIVYAARWHELTPEEDARISWTLPGSGRKYLETKIVRHKDKYTKIVADFLQNLLSKGGSNV